MSEQTKPTPECGNCIYFEPGDDRWSVGKCHRYPPNWCGEWSRTYPYEVCGEFKLKEFKLKEEKADVQEL